MTVRDATTGAPLPGVDATASSMGFVTSRSMSSGDAPGYTVCTSMIGKSTGGNWSTGSWL